MRPAKSADDNKSERNCCDANRNQAVKCASDNVRRRGSCALVKDNPAQVRDQDAEE